MSFFSEFKEFAVKGNVIDLAVGVIIGGAFGKIVDSMVSDLIMPLISGLIGSVDFSNFYLVLSTVPQGVENSLAGLKAAGIPVFAYGSFITILINFIILAFVIFVMIKQVNRLRRSVDSEPVIEAAKEAPEPQDVQLLREIRDALIKK